MLNKVILMGRLVADPEFRQTTSGIPVCRIRIAIDRPYRKDQERQSGRRVCKYIYDRSQRKAGDQGRRSI